MPAAPETVAALKENFPDVVESEFREEMRIVVTREALFEALEFLKETRGFDLLVDITCVDYLNYRDATARFGLVYLLANTVTNERLTVRCFLDEPDLTIPSATPLWDGADWLEREVYDMFGIEFEGHPHLRRILMPEEFTAFPLRKDYPMQGRGERHNFPVLRRGES
jgi:NADH-quinone oxidoreductase subunit C